MQNFGEAVAFIWGVADLIRDTFRRGKYQDVILPFTVLRRIDCVLQPDAAIEALEGEILSMLRTGGGMNLRQRGGEPLAIEPHRHIGLE